MSEESPFPLLNSPWAEGYEPWSQNIDLNEFPSLAPRGLANAGVSLIDLRHKLEIEHPGARWVGVRRNESRGPNFTSPPAHVLPLASVAVWERIDTEFEDSLHKPAAKKCRR
jgi:hypothetical protein